MQAWLYQMRSTKEWRPEDYRIEAWEGQRIIWPTGSVLPRGLGEIVPGDTLVLFFSKSGNPYPGIYGWGVICRCDQRRKTIEFQLAPPSDYLKIDPVWDQDIHRLLDRVRENSSRKTILGISWDEFEQIRYKIRERACFGTANAQRAARPVR